MRPRDCLNLLLLAIGLPTLGQRKFDTQPLCDDCRDVDHPVEQSRRLGQGTLEQCCQCGELTRSGIYVRLELSTVRYPQGD